MRDEVPPPGQTPAYVPGAPNEQAPPPDPLGALTTRLGMPAPRRPLRSPREQAEADTAEVLAALAVVATALHRHAGVLEQAVEGQFSTDLADPRTRLLGESLRIAREADLRLARLEATLARLRTSTAAAAHQLEDLRREREHLATLYQVARELNSALDLDDLLGRVLVQLIEVTRAERGFLMLREGEALRFVAARGADGQPLAERDFGISSGLVRRVWDDQEPLLTTDAVADARLAEHASIRAFGIRAVMCAPLRLRGVGVGVVYVDSRTEAQLFGPEHLDLLAAFCNQAAIAVENARLVADLRARLRQISEMKTYMENIFASITSGVITTDLDGRITTFNRAAERLLGCAEGSALGARYAEVLAPLADAHLLDLLQRAAQGTLLAHAYEAERALPQRERVALRVSVSPLRAEGGGAEPLGAALVLDDLTELRQSQRQAEEISRLFGRYVHPAVVRQLLADPAAVQLGGETREVTVLFADIRGYTGLAEQLAPQALVGVLNTYLEVLTAAVWEEEGTVTMFIGDALMAIFNAPLLQADHALRAVRAAAAMRRALTTVPHPGPETPVTYGIGVHTGLAVVGNIGAQGRLQNYTAIGDAVNTAQRLQASAAANQVLVSDATAARVAPHVALTRQEPLHVKGKARPLEVFALSDTPLE